MTPSRKRWAVLLAGAVVLLLAGGWFFVDVAARRSAFCGRCHYMTPYVDQWKASTHKGVDCVACHPTQRRAMFAQAVKYWTGTYQPRPHAYVPDEACRTCHGDVAASKGVKFLAVTFPHAPHMGVDRRGIRLHCASCHGYSEEAGHVGVDKRICYLCHFKGQAPAQTVAGCGACHGAPGGMTRHGGFLFDMKAYVDSGVACGRCHLSVHEGGGGVSRDKCYSCHVSRVEKIGDARAVHNQHVTVKEIRCLECHEPIRHGNIKVLSVLDVSCESCHSSLHSGPKEMYLGVGAKGAPETPSRMFAAQINCTGCHTQVLTQGGSAFLGQGSKSADPRACAACHDARFIPMVDRWKSQGAALAAEARRLARQGATLAASAKGSPEAARLAVDLEFNARLLEQGHPVHNIEYAVKTVQASGALLEKLGEAAGRKMAPPVQLSLAKGPFGYCTESCHTFIPRAEPYDFQGTDLPHAFHLRRAGLSCDVCHEAGKHKALALASPRDCAPCHHESAKADCARCHPRQTSLYRGAPPPALGIAGKADSMAEGVGCGDCHDPTKADALREVGKACASCHDAQGPKELETWRADLKRTRERVQASEDQVQMALGALRRRGADTAAAGRRLDAIRARLAYLDRAGGVHNRVLAGAELERARRELDELLAELAR